MSIVRPLRKPWFLMGMAGIACLVIGLFIGARVPQPMDCSERLTRIPSLSAG